MSVLLPRQANPSGTFRYPPEGGPRQCWALETTQNITSPPQTSFLWTVQPYDFDLAKSDVFFFWIFNGIDAAAQGIVSPPSVSTSYFAIREREHCQHLVHVGTLTTASESEAATSTATRASNGDGATGTPASETSLAAGGGGSVKVVAVGVSVRPGSWTSMALFALTSSWGNRSPSSVSLRSPRR